MSSFWMSLGMIIPFLCGVLMGWILLYKFIQFLRGKISSKEK